MNVQLINKELLAELHRKATESERFRINFYMRKSMEDGSQRMLNALEPGAEMPVYRHHGSFETVVILRGRVRWVFYDENAVETESVVLDADGNVRCINVERDRWHSLECMASGTILRQSLRSTCPLNFTSH